MALPWVLAVLSLLPLLEAQNPASSNITAVPITNATLNWLAGKWFYIGFAARDPEYKQAAQQIQTEFFYFYPNLTEDTILLREYLTTEDRCVYNASQLRVQRKNGTLSKLVGDKEYVAHLKLLKEPRIFMLAHNPEDEKNQGLSFYADRPDVTPEHLEVFREAVIKAGMSKSEIIYTDWKKDLCGPLHRQPELQETKAEEEKP